MPDDPRIKSIRTVAADEDETWEVGELFMPVDPDLGLVTKIVRTANGAYEIENEHGTRVVYAAQFVTDVEFF